MPPKPKIFKKKRKRAVPKKLKAQKLPKWSLHPSQPSSNIRMRQGNKRTAPAQFKGLADEERRQKGWVRLHAACLPHAVSLQVRAATHCAIPCA